MIARERLFATAHSVAIDLVGRDTDPNELDKLATYLYTHLDGRQFFHLLETVVKEKESRYLVRTGRTLDYYRDIMEACQQHLGEYRLAKDQQAQEMAEILGWAVRLMRYYKEVGVPPMEQSPWKGSAPLMPSSQSLRETVLRAATQEAILQVAMVTSKRELVTLIEDAKRGRAQVRNAEGEEFICTEFPQVGANLGKRCRVEVTRKDGKVQQGKFKGWERA